MSNSPPVTFTPEAAERIARAVRWVEQHGMRQQPSCPPLDLSPAVQLVKATSGTADGDGHYPGVPTAWDENAGSWIEYDAVKVKPSDGEALTSGERYPCHPVGYTSGGDALYLTLAKHAGAVSEITVEAVDGTPSYTGISTLKVDETDGLTITNPAAGVVRLDIEATGPSQNGIVTYSTQIIDGLKSLRDGIHVFSDHFGSQVVSVCASDSLYGADLTFGLSSNRAYASLEGYFSGHGYLVAATYYDTPAHLYPRTLWLMGNDEFRLYKGDGAGGFNYDDVRIIAGHYSTTDGAGVDVPGGTATTGGLTFREGLYVSGAASGGVWGSITGTLSSQTDLQSALVQQRVKGWMGV